MDIVSHGLWGGAAFGRKNKKNFWTAFLFGILPDFLAFGPFFTGIFLGFYKWPGFGPEPPPDPSLVPSYIGQVYNITHSLIVFAVVFFLVWLIFKKPVYEMLAWGLHILFDIPTHSYQFFPTPFLWPISNFEVNGQSWATPYIFFPNALLLIIFYLYFFVIKKREIKRGGSAL